MVLPLKATSSANLAHRPLGGADKVAQVEVDRGLRHVDEVIAHAAAGLRGRLGRAGVQPAVDLHRVDPDDLAVERDGEMLSHAGLADGSRPKENHQWGMG